MTYHITDKLDMVSKKRHHDTYSLRHSVTEDAEYFRKVQFEVYYKIYHD